MAKKQRNGKAPRHTKGKKAPRNETITPNDIDDDVDDVDEILDSHARKSRRVDTSIALFLLGAFVALAAALWPYVDGVGADKPANPQTAGGGFGKNRRASLSELFHIACKQTRLVRCEKGVFHIDDETRSIRTRSSADKQNPVLKRGQLLLSIPRSVQTTTLDALRDERVNQILRRNPRHGKSGKPLHPKAFLALHLAFELSQLAGNNGTGKDNSSPEGLLRRAYLEYLPTHQDFLRFHPISKETLKHPVEDGNPLLPPVSLTDHLVDQYFRCYLSEYQALRRVSPDLQKMVSLQDWITSRLIVQSRTFEVDPLTEDDIDNQELETYRPFLSDSESLSQEETLLFYENCRQTLMRSSMVPLLDALDHHQTANVGWRFMASESSLNSAKSFLNYANQDIYPDTHVSHSYYASSPEPLVFAKYGFVNPYGTGDRAALLTPYHRLLNEEFESNGSKKNQDLQKYLSFRDGYERCDEQRHTDEPNERTVFETAKLNALQTISNQLEFWMAVLPPKDGQGSGDLNRVLSMCRLLAMTHRDYGGKAIQILQAVIDSDHPEQYQFRDSSDEATSEGLEYRACHVLERLADAMRAKVVKSIASLVPMENLEDALNTSQSVRAVDALRRNLVASYIDPSSWEGTSALVRLGELETLTILGQNARERKQELLSNKEWRSANGTIMDEEDYFVRDAPCPW